jgi:hypothetical protein
MYKPMKKRERNKSRENQEEASEEYDEGAMKLLEENIKKKPLILKRQAERIHGKRSRLHKKLKRAETDQESTRKHKAERQTETICSTSETKP